MSSAERAPAAIAGCWRPRRWLTQASRRPAAAAGSSTGVGQRTAASTSAAADQRSSASCFDAQVVLGRDLLRQHEVVARLRLARVGDGGRCRPRSCAWPRRAARRSPSSARARRQRVLRRQHVEVGLADADDQVLLGGVELRLRRGRPALALPMVAQLAGRYSGCEALQRAPARCWCCSGADRPARARSSCVAPARAGARFGRGSASACAARYWLASYCAVADCQVGVVAARRLVQLEQALRLRRRCRRPRASSSASDAPAGKRPRRRSRASVAVEGVGAGMLLSLWSSVARHAPGRARRDQASMPPARSHGVEVRQERARACARRGGTRTLAGSSWPAALFIGIDRSNPRTLARSSGSRTSRHGARQATSGVGGRTVDHQNLKREGSGKPSRRGASVSQGCAVRVAVFAGAGDEGGAHHRLVADDGGQAAADLQLRAAGAAAPRPPSRTAR